MDALIYRYIFLSWRQCKLQQIIETTEQRDQESIISCQSFSFSGVTEKQSHEKRCSSPNFDSNEWKKKKHQFLIRAVLFRDFLNGDAYLVAQVPPGVHHAIGAFTQNHLITILIGLINILMEMEEMRLLRENLRKYSKNEEYTTLEYSHFTTVYKYTYIFASNMFFKLVFLNS